MKKERGGVPKNYSQNISLNSREYRENYKRARIGNNYTQWNNCYRHNEILRKIAKGSRYSVTKLLYYLIIPLSTLIYRDYSLYMWFWLVSCIVFSHYSNDEIASDMSYSWQYLQKKGKIRYKYNGYFHLQQEDDKLSSLRRCPRSLKFGTTLLSLTQWTINFIVNKLRRRF